MCCEPDHSFQPVPDVPRKILSCICPGYVSSTWCPWQEAEELFEVTAQCLMSGQDRDAISGWGAIIHVM